MSTVTAIHELLDSRDFRRDLNECIARAIASVGLRAPRSEEERRNGFKGWLQQTRAEMAPAIQREFVRQFGVAVGTSGRAKRSVETLFDELVWPQAEDYFRRFAIRSLAARWAIAALGDRVGIAWPEPLDDGWVATLDVSGRPVGRVVLDADGNVVPAGSSTRTDVLGALDGR